MPASTVFPSSVATSKEIKPVIKEISELQISSGLVKDAMLTKLKRLQMGLNDPIFSVWNRHKNFVFE
jgi:hypothetical protein